MFKTRSDVHSVVSVSSRFSNLSLTRSITNITSQTNQTNQTNHTNPKSNAGHSSTGKDENELVKAETNLSNRSHDSSYQEAPKYKIKLSLTNHEIDLLRYTWSKMLMDEPLDTGSSQIPGGYGTDKFISTNSRTVFCEQLYATLFEMEPTLIHEFPSIQHQASAFAGVISMTISQLENLETIDDYLCNLGKRHSRILNIQPAQFELLGEALVTAFHERFGLQFTEELEVLWIKLYMYLANSMIQFGMDPHIRTIESSEEPQPQKVSKSSLLGLKHGVMRTLLFPVWDIDY